MPKLVPVNGNPDVINCQSNYHQRIFHDFARLARLFNLVENILFIYNKHYLFNKIWQIWQGLVVFRCRVRVDAESPEASLHLCTNELR